MSVYLIIDTQMIVGGHYLKYSIDDYIMASVNLYLDIINIFIYLLAIMGK
jgi:FtsH-binding integral membrane protein